MVIYGFFSMDEITPERILNELQYCREVGNSRLTILFIHLFTEHFVHRICKVEKIESKASLKNRAKELVKKKIITEKLGEIIELTYELRNDLIHNLNPSVKNIELKIEKFKFDPNNRSKISQAWKYNSPWSKLDVISFPTIFKLYSILNELSGQPLNYCLDVNVDDKKQFCFKLLKKDH